jgi:PAS domain S-box-containing protein
MPNLEEKKRETDVKLEATLKLIQMYGASRREITAFAIEEALTITASKLGYLGFFNDEETELTIPSWSGGMMREWQIEGKPITYRIEDLGVWGEALHRRQPVIVNSSLHYDPSKRGLPDGYVEIQRYMNVPIFDGTKLVALVGVANKETIYENDDVQNLSLLMRAMWQLLERKRAEEALYESEQRHRTISEIVSDHAYSFRVCEGSELEIEWETEAIERITGLTAEEIKLLGHRIRFVHHGDRGAYKFHYQQVLAGKSDICDYRIITKEGNIRWMRDYAHPLRDPVTKSVIKVYGASQDITERKRVEAELRESEASHRSLVENLPGIVYRIFVRLGMQIGFFNDYISKLTGYTTDEFVHEKRKSMDFLIVEDDRLRVKEAIQESLRNNKPYEIEYKLRTKQGEIRSVIDRGSPIIGSDRQPFFIDGIILDITELKQSEEASRHTQKMESLGILAGGVAHDFNNLLQAILGQNSIALMKLDKDSSAYTNIKKAEQAAHRASELTQQLLAYSGKGKFQERELQVNDIVSENMHLLEVSISKNVRIHEELQSDLWYICADPGQLQQIIMNLIINAGEAIGEQQGNIWISTRMMVLKESDELWCAKLHEPLQNGNYVVLEVRDDGCGISPAVLEKIFDPFFSTKFTGRGLGLSAVLGIVKGHKGGVCVESVEGGGTTFKIALPGIKHALRSEVDKVTTSATIDGLILIVDDEEIVREVVSDLLEMNGITSVSVSNGYAALKVYRERQREIVAVVLDLSMPEMDGVVVAKRLKEINSEVRIILSSGYSEVEAQARFAETGLEAFIQKPFASDTLVELLKKITQSEIKPSHQQQ